MKNWRWKIDKKRLAKKIKNKYKEEEKKVKTHTKNAK